MSRWSREQLQALIASWPNPTPDMVRDCSIFGCLQYRAYLYRCRAYWRLAGQRVEVARLTQWIDVETRHIASLRDVAVRVCKVVQFNPVNK